MQSWEDTVLNIHAKEFYPVNHVETHTFTGVVTKCKRRRGIGTRWAERKGPSGTTTSAPATANNDGNAEPVIQHDVDAGLAQVIDVGDAETPGGC